MTIKTVSKQKRENIFRRMLMAFIVYVAMIPAGSAQSIWTNRIDDRVIGLEFLQPKFSGNTSGYILTLSARLPVSSSIHLTAELPYAHGVYSSPGTSQSHDMIGNPYLGLEIDTRYSFMFLEVGTRIPIAPETKTFAIDAGNKGDVDRFEAYTPNTLQLTGAVNLQPKLTTAIGFRLRVGPSFDIALKQTNTSSTDLYLLYSEQLFYHDELVYAGIGLTGRTILTNSRTNDRTVDIFELVAKVHAGKFLPGATLRFPLDRSLSSIVTLTYGVSMEMSL